jgi:zinc protease
MLNHTFPMKFITFIGLTLSLSLSAGLAQIAPQVQRAQIAGLDVLIYKTGVNDVVTIEGSLPAGDIFAGDGNVAIPTLTGMLLEQGTTTQNQFAIAEKLERVGASISFSAGAQMLNITAKCLKKDVALVIGLIAEQLRSPALAAEELAKAKKQFSGTLQRQLENTDFRAGDAFNRAAYPAGHPNHEPSTDEYLAAIASATIEEIRAFHAKYYGPAHCTLVLVGDVDATVISTALTASFQGWTGGVDLPHPAKATATDSAKNQNVFIPGKTSVSVVIGQTTGLKYSDPDYQALKVATAVLGGGGFSGRLMQTVRDKEGLTYGIYSNVTQDTFSDGDWRLTATFAPALLEKGIASAKAQLANWYNQGITPDELTYRKTNLVGSFKVGLATTDGLAAALLMALHRGYDQTWLDQYPQVIEALTLAQVNSVAKKYLKPDEMFIIKAGTIPGVVNTPAAKK